ncbi:DUF4262 domain-containing protein [Streptomyces sp. BH055]|uniref:DUF4262 domain-containing protein n=1 Tax=unclassified Streptomyces TaxID=2593676 RepID=UPI003BB72BD0
MSEQPQPLHFPPFVPVEMSATVNGKTLTRRLSVDALLLEHPDYRDALRTRLRAELGHDIVRRLDPPMRIAAPAPSPTGPPGRRPAGPRAGGRSGQPQAREDAPVDYEFAAEIAERIRQSREHVIYADCDPLMVDPTTTYTVGFHVKGRSGGYELAVSGLPARAAARVLNDVSDRFLNTPGAALKPGMLLFGVQGYTVKLRRADDPSFLVMSHALWDGPAPALQVLIPDANGAFPDQLAYANGINGQRLL